MRADLLVADCDCFVSLLLRAVSKITVTWLMQAALAAPRNMNSCLHILYMHVLVE